MEALINGIIQSYLPGLTPIVQTVIQSESAPSPVPVPSPVPSPVPRNELHLDRAQFEVENQNPDDDEPEIVPVDTKIRVVTEDDNFGRLAIILSSPTTPYSKYVAKFIKEESKPSINVEQIERLQNQIAAISNDVQHICDDLSSKADVKALDDKASYDVVSLVEKSVEDVIFDLGIYILTTTLILIIIFLLLLS